MCPRQEAALKKLKRFSFENNSIAMEKPGDY